jgi:glycopeptide antibiotics resistance protein
MGIFKSFKEQKYWLGAVLISLTILSTLFIGQPLLHYFENQNLRAAVFFTVLIFIGVALIIHSILNKESSQVIAALIGLFAVYTMFFLRLGMPERSHLIEFTILTIFVHRALLERYQEKSEIIKSTILAFLIASSIGVLDECLQLLIPKRVFDLEDIIFNCLASLMAAVSYLFIRWIKRRILFKQQKSIS